MVSTRGVKLKFVEGERVLCYEPDPTKAKVLYDSKVLDVVFNKDHKGKKNVEYLIHFQGWNSSWDRCVSEEFVLKDTPENRQLQRDLAEKSQLQLGAYLYRKERKKHSTKPNESAAGQSSEDGSSGSPARMDTDEGQATSSSEDDSSTEEEYIPIELTPNLKQLLEHDYHMIYSNNMLHKLPAEPNVVDILEIYFKHFSNHQVCNNNEKSSSRYRSHYQTQKPSVEDIHKSLLACREFLDGIRLYFDNTLNDLLLYKQEKNLFPTSQVIYRSIADMNQANEHSNHLNYQSKAQADEENGMQNLEQEKNGGASRRKSLRSYTNQETSHINGNSSAPEVSTSHKNGNKPSPSIASSNSEASAPPFVMKTIAWRLLPEHAYHQRPPPPCLVYGATHLTRLLVKMPELLSASSIQDANLKKLIRHMELFIDFLNEHKEWYGEKYYQTA
ncbi:hypothetical protein HHI36_016194 [Cryptolaemus montrouzieri]|uniref:Protein male-specific lethal-3 n=1 Tax=Cryptolaemus montrouzieri TaxID=559131 RepID=A0ABD2NJP4_9CUCU